MTQQLPEPTPEQLAMARRIAAKEGYETYPTVVNIILAAIIETTERAAKYIDRHYDSGDRDTYFERQIASDFRNNEHLKDRP